MQTCMIIDAFSRRSDAHCNRDGLRSSHNFITKMRTLFTIILIFSVQIAVFAQKSAISFKDVSADSGMNVSHISTAENRYIIESMSGGAAVFDCDGDNFLDVATIKRFIG